MAILELNGVTTENSTINMQLTDEAAQLLKDGELDILMMVAGAASPRVNDPLMTPGIHLLTVRHADAYIARLKNVSSHVLPEGVIGLAQNIPPEDTLLIAAKATLAAGPDLHPDLARLLLVISNEVHSPGGILEEPRSFPQPRGRDPDKRRGSPLPGKRANRAGTLFALVARFTPQSVTLPAVAGGSGTAPGLARVAGADGLLLLEPYQPALPMCASSSAR